MACRWQRKIGFVRLQYNSSDINVTQERLLLGNDAIKNVTANESLKEELGIVFVCSFAVNTRNYRGTYVLIYVIQARF